MARTQFQWKPGQFRAGFEASDVYRDASGQLRTAAGARLQWGAKAEVDATLLGDGSLELDKPNLGGTDAQKKKKKQGTGLYQSNRNATPSNDYSLMNQNTLLGG